MPKRPGFGDSRYHLTPAQLAVLVAFYRYRYPTKCRRGKKAPTDRELMFEIGCSTRHIARQHITALAARGMLGRVAEEKNRCWRLTPKGVARAKKRKDLLEKREKEARARERERRRKRGK